METLSFDEFEARLESIINDIWKEEIEDTVYLKIPLLPKDIEKDINNLSKHIFKLGFARGRIHLLKSMNKTIDNYYPD